MLRFLGRSALKTGGKQLHRVRITPQPLQKAAFALIGIAGISATWLSLPVAYNDVYAPDKELDKSTTPAPTSSAFDIALELSTIKYKDVSRYGVGCIHGASFSSYVLHISLS